MTGFAKATAACGRALLAFSTVFFLKSLTVAALLLIASPSPVEAASPGVPGGTCTIAFGTVPYASSGNIHVQAGGSVEQIDCDPRYPAADSGIAPPNSGASSGGGTWSAVANVSDNTVTYSPHPSWVGPDTFTMYFCNDVNCTGAGRVTATVNVTVTAPTLSLTASLPNGTVAAPYSQVLTASGGAAPYTFSVLSGTLPTGLSLTGATSTNVTLSGTPTAGGTFNFTIRATDSSIGTGPINTDQAYAVTIAAPTIAVGPTTIPNGTQGAAYSQTLTASGGIATYTWSVSAGALPAGLSLGAGGVLSGTPTAAGPFNFTARAQDSSTGDGPYAGSRDYAFAIAAVAAVANPVSATVAHNSTGNPITLNITGGAPASVAVATNGSNGTATAVGSTITYTPTAGYAGPDNFSYTATNVAGTSSPATVTITVNPPTLALNPSTLPDGTTGIAYSQAASASGGQSPYTYSISAGTLPAGLGINPTTGAISGTPTATGVSNFTVRAQDSSTGPAAPFAVTRTFAVTIVPPPLEIASPAPGALPAATGGTAYSQTFVASGGQAPHRFDIGMGALPAGVTFTSTGVLSGTPTVSGTFNFTLTTTDSSPSPGPYTSAPVAYSLTVNAPTITLTPASLTTATTAVAYSETVTANGGTAPYSFGISAGSLPAGISFNSAGLLSGTPTAAGTYNFTIIATDTHGFTNSRAYTVVVADPVITVTAPAAGALPSATGGTAYSQTFTASGSQGSHSFSLIAGALPIGMSLTSAGVLSGTPSVSGTFNFSLVASDSSPAPGPFASAPVAYSLTVSTPVITVSPTSLPNAIATLAYSETVTASGGTAPYSFSLSAGSLPTGMSFSSAGAFSGTPSTAGTYNFTVTVADTHGFTGSRAYSVVVDDQPGQVTMLVSSPADGAFGFSSSEPALNFTVNTASGSGTSGARTLPLGNHSFALSVPAGFELAAASCDSAGSTIDPATLSGALNVTPGVVITCTLSGADPSQTTGLIGAFLEARSGLVLANEPDASRRIERLTGAYSGSGGVSGFGLGFTDQRMPLALSLSEAEASFGYSLRRSQAQGGATSTASTRDQSSGQGRGMMSSPIDGGAPLAAFSDNAPPPATPWPRQPDIGPDETAAIDPMATPFDIWIEGKLARFSADGGDGRFGILHAGVDYLVTPRILVGLGAQLDWTDMDGSGASTISGTGYLVGPYVTARLTDNLFLDGRAAWGQSANDVSPFGTYTDKLDATRWLVSLALIGQYDIDRWRLSPKAKLAYFEEETEPYLDSLGLDIPSISIATGTLEFGPTLSYRMELDNGMSFEPFATLEGIWTFKQENTATAATSSPGLGETGLRGRGEIGFTLSGQSASSLSSAIFYDGVGDDDFQSWGGRLRFNRRF